MHLVSDIHLPNDTNGASDGHSSNWVPILESAVYAPKRLRVVCIGAGYSGLMLAYYLREMKMEDYVGLRIYEKNHDVGGTWLENRYPGVAW